MATTYTNLGPIYLTQEKFNALVTANQLEVGREYKIVDWEAQEKLVAGTNITIADDGKTISAVSPDLSSYATQTWVEDKNYLTEHQDLSGYVDTTNDQDIYGDKTFHAPVAYGTGLNATFLDDKKIRTTGAMSPERIYNLPEDDDLEVTLASRAWVESQNYLTEHQSLDDYATQTWVEDKGYLTEHQSLTDYATQNWVEENYSTVALRPMKEEWTGTNLTTQQAADAILGDADTKVGDGFLGEVSWSDMYASIRLMNGEVKAFVVSEDIVQFEITSSTTEPYAWFYNSFAEEWRSYVPLVDNLTTDNVYSALTAKQGKVLNDSKQDKLTAGTGITIENNVISASSSDSSDAGMFVATYGETSLADIKTAYQAGKMIKLKYNPDDGQATYYADLCQVAEFAYATYGDQGTTFFFSCPKIYWSLSPTLFENQGTYFFAVYRGKSLTSDTWSNKLVTDSVPNASASTVGGIKMYNDTENNILYVTNDGTDPTPSA